MNHMSIMSGSQVPGHVRGVSSWFSLSGKQISSFILYQAKEREEAKNRRKKKKKKTPKGGRSQDIIEEQQFNTSFQEYYTVNVKNINRAASAYSNRIYCDQLQVYTKTPSTLPSSHVERPAVLVHHGRAGTSPTEVADLPPAPGGDENLRDAMVG